MFISNDGSITQPDLNNDLSISSIIRGQFQNFCWRGLWAPVWSEEQGTNLKAASARYRTLQEHKLSDGADVHGALVLLLLCQPMEQHQNHNYLYLIDFYLMSYNFTIFTPSHLHHVLKSNAIHDYYTHTMYSEIRIEVLDIFFYILKFIIQYRYRFGILWKK